MLRAFLGCFLAGARTRASIAVSLFDHSNPYKRTQAQLSAGSTPTAYSPSSSSLLGPLNLHMYLDQALLPGVLAPSRPFDIGTCIEEDELEHETSSQPSLSTYNPAVCQHAPECAGSSPHLALCCAVRPGSLGSQQSLPHSQTWGREGPVLPRQLCLSFHGGRVSSDIGNSKADLQPSQWQAYWGCSGLGDQRLCLCLPAPLVPAFALASPVQRPLGFPCVKFPILISGIIFYTSLGYFVA